MLRSEKLEILKLVEELIDTVVGFDEIDNEEIEETTCKNCNDCNDCESSKHPKTAMLTYNKKKNEAVFEGIEPEEIDPNYLKYLLEHLEIPTNAKIYFGKKRKTL